MRYASVKPAAALKPIAFGRKPGTNLIWFAYRDAGAGAIVVNTVDTSDNNSPFVPVAAPLGSVATTGGQSVDVSNTSRSFFPTNAGILKMDWIANTLTLIAASPAVSHCVAIHGDRMVSAQGAVLRYSAPADFNTWPVLNTITVGNSRINGIYSVRSNLVIIKDDYSIWVLTGVPGVNETLREVLPRYTGNVDSFDFQAASPTRDGFLWWGVPGMDRPANQYLARFGGGASKEYSNLEVDAGYSSAGVIRSVAVPLHQSDSVALIGASNTAGNVNLIERHNGVWTKHVLDFSLAPAGSVHPLFAEHVGRGRIVFAAESATGWELYSYQAAWDVVPSASGQLGVAPLPGFDVFDGADGLGVRPYIPASLELAEYMPGGMSRRFGYHARELRCHTVVVDATIHPRSYLGPEPTNPTYTCMLKYTGVDVFDSSTTFGPAIGRDVDTATQVALGSISFAENAIDVTFRHSFEPIQGRGVRPIFTNIQGVSFRRVTLLGDMDPQR